MFVQTRKNKTPFAVARLVLVAVLACAQILSVPIESLAQKEARSVADDASFLTIALPANGEVRVENRRGGVEAEVWDESFVGLSATGGEERSSSAKNRRGGSVSRRSPAQIERSEALLSINVPRANSNQSGAVSLKVRLPRRARARIFTSEGAIEVRGLPLNLSAQTLSGEIRLSVSQNADVTAHSLNGTVVFESADGTAEPSRQVDRAKFHVRLGAGESVANLFSGRGAIHVNASATHPAADASRAARENSASAQEGTPRDETARDETARKEASREAREDLETKPPVLGGSNNATTRTPAGTPDANPSGEPEEVGDDEVVRVDTELVTVSVSVVDRARGQAVAGLTREDFKLYEDGAEQQIEHFETSSAPFDLLLLIDLSGSTAKVINPNGANRTVADVIRAAALRFIEAARPQDRIGVVAFAGEARTVSPLTSDRERLRTSIRAMERPFGDTRLYDATAFALEMFEREAAGHRRRAVVLLSDGLDSTLPNVGGAGSAIPYEELRSRVEEFDGLFYTIWTDASYEAFSPEDVQAETFDLAADRLQELSETGGGASYEIERLEDLAGAYERVIADLSSVYSLSYRPTNRVRDGRWRAIRLRVLRPDTVARGRRGYYAN